MKFSRRSIPTHEAQYKITLCQETPKNEHSDNWKKYISILHPQYYLILGHSLVKKNNNN